MTHAWVQEVERRLGYRFRRRTLLRAALTHPSAGPEGKAFRRLAFLGDAVLTFLLGLHVYQDHPHLPPGGLTRLRASLVNRTTLARAAAELGLPMLFRLGKGDEPEGRERPSVLATGFEAVLAAIYLDRGLGAVRTFLEQHLLSLTIPDDSLDPKSELQTRLQQVFKIRPRYRLLRQLGPPHAPRFEVEVKAGGRRLAKGMGRSRHEAEHMAAQAALAGLWRDSNIWGPSSG